MGTWSKRISGTRQNHFDIRRIRVVFCSNHQQFSFIAFRYWFRIVFHSKIFAISFRKPNKFDWRHVSNTSCAFHRISNTTTRCWLCVCARDANDRVTIRKRDKMTHEYRHCIFRTIQASASVEWYHSPASKQSLLSDKLSISLIPRRLLVLHRAHSPLDGRLSCLSENMKFKLNTTASNIMTTFQTLSFGFRNGFQELLNSIVHSFC